LWSKTTIGDTVENQNIFKNRTNPWEDMGRIKLQLVKRTTNNLMKEHKDEFKKDFSENKKVVNRYTDVSNRKLRNIIAGYATKLMKKESSQEQ